MGWRAVLRPAKHTRGPPTWDNVVQLEESLRESRPEIAPTTDKARLPKSRGARQQAEEKRAAVEARIAERREQEERAGKKIRGREPCPEGLSQPRDWAVTTVWPGRARMRLSGVAWSKRMSIERHGGPIRR